MKTIARLSCISLVSSVLFGGCALTPHGVTGGEDATAHGNQSETSFAVNQIGDQRVITVAYNDGTDQKAIQYTSTTRVTRKGATMMGWSYSIDSGLHWTYGGRIATNDAWPVLWGDPGITNSARDPHYVYIANLAVPMAKFAAAPGGQIDGPLNNYIGGACIARSTDGGKHFSLYQCVQTTESDSTGDFYDGGNMASDGNGNIYAGWVNVDRNAIHIWRAAGEGATFTKLVTNPFASEYMVSHPRLRVNAENGNLWVMALNLGGELLLARWDGSSWSAPWHTGLHAQGYPCVMSSGAVGCASDVVVRTGPQFSFDIGSSGKGNDHIRVMFTRKGAANGRLYIAGGGCTIATLACQYIPEWGTGEGGADKVDSSFNPLIRAYRSGEMAKNGEPSLWMGSHETFRPANGRITFAMGGVAVITSGANPPAFIYLPIYSLANRIVCADLRGYWGDYDDLQALGPKGSSVVFARTYTDSNAGCAFRWQYTSSAVHVGFTAP